MPHQDILIDAPESEWAGIFAARVNGRVVFARLSRGRDNEVRVPNEVTHAERITGGFLFSFPSGGNTPQLVGQVYAAERDSGGRGYRSLKVD